VNKTTSEAAEYLGRVLTGYKQTLPYKKWLPFLSSLESPQGRHSDTWNWLASRRIWDLTR